MSPKIDVGTASGLTLVVAAAMAVGFLLPLDTAAQDGRLNVAVRNCNVRGFFKLINVQMDTPGAAFQLIVPIAFFVMALRFLGLGIRDLKRLLNNDLEDDISTHGLTGAAHEVADDVAHQEGR